MKWFQNLEAVGWGFFLIAFAVLSVPFAWLTWAATGPDVPALERGGLGVVMAALLAAVLAWVVNELLYRRQLRLHEAERKQERKTEKKKKKRHH